MSSGKFLCNSPPFDEETKRPTQLAKNARWSSAYNKGDSVVAPAPQKSALAHHWEAKVEATAFLENQIPPPNPELTEIAIAGRSNVGKSSLINVLLGTKVARVAAAPGKTRSINFYKVQISRKITVDETAQPTKETKILRVVDLPGYGYAARGKGERKEWSKLISQYMKNRENLAAVFHLVDIRHGLLDSDRDLQDWLSGLKRKFVVVFTKADKIASGKRKDLMHKYIREGLRTDAMPIITSAETRDSGAALGIADLRDFIENLIF